MQTLAVDIASTFVDDAAALATGLGRALLRFAMAPIDRIANACDIAGVLAERRDGRVHFVAHSMGGLLTRVYIARHRPMRLGRVVMLGTPNGGSEVADLLKDLAIYRAVFGPAGLQLTTIPDPVLADLPSPDYEIGIIAGCRTIAPIASAFVLPWPNDGRVSVASAKLDGMADHVIVKAPHAGLPRHAVALEQTIAFLREGRFRSL